MRKLRQSLHEIVAAEVKKENPSLQIHDSLPHSSSNIIQDMLIKSSEIPEKSAHSNQSIPSHVKNVSKGNTVYKPSQFSQEVSQLEELDKDSEVKEIKVIFR